MADVERAMNTPLPTGTPQPLPMGRGEKGALTKEKNARRAKRAKKKAAKKRKPGRPKGALNVASKRTNARNTVNMDLGSALALVQGMHRTDVAVFQSISAALSDKGKPSRKRLLAAINKVFG